MYVDGSTFTVNGRQRVAMSQDICDISYLGYLMC